jgi:hypothetical protein
MDYLAAKGAHLLERCRKIGHGEIGKREAVSWARAALVDADRDPRVHGLPTLTLVREQTDVWSDADSDCEPLTVDKADTTSQTSVVRDDTGASVPLNGHVPLGTSVHDTATVGDKVDGFDITGTVTYHFYTGPDCQGENEVGTGEPVTIANDGSVPDSSSQGPLAAGDYSFNAEYGGNDNYNASGLSDCEPFTIDKANTTSHTSVIREDTGAAVPLNGSVPIGTSVHDTATVGTQVNGFVISGTVTYHFYNSIDCTGNEFGSPWPQAVLLAGGLVPDSQSTGPLGAGSYSFQAVYSGDSNYNGSTGACEPFGALTHGKTMGFWGNKNGQALLAAHSYSPAVPLGISGGCYVLVNNATKSKEILPLTLNGITLTTSTLSPSETRLLRPLVPLRGRETARLRASTPSVASRENVPRATPKKVSEKERERVAEVVALRRSPPLPFRCEMCPPTTFASTAGSAL